MRVAIQTYPHPSNLIETIRIIREHTGLSLVAARQVVYVIPTELEVYGETAARRLAEDLNEIGIEAEFLGEKEVAQVVSDPLGNLAESESTPPEFGPEGDAMQGTNDP